MGYTEDILHEIYDEVCSCGLKEKFDAQLEKMKAQDKHRFKNVKERWEYALYRIKGGPPENE